MNKLINTEKELVPVYVTETGEKVVDGRELYYALTSKSKFADWIKNRLEDCEAIENEDYETVSKNLESGGKTKEYIIKLDTAKEMAMLDRSDTGKEVRKYFIKIEKEHKQQKLMSPMELLELQFAAMKEQKQEIVQVTTRVDKLENTMTIDYAQQQELVSITNRVATAALGGKKTTAYKIMSKVLFAKVWHDFKEYFEVNSYKNTPTVRFEEAQLYLESWMPDTNLKLEIVKINKNIA